MSIRSLLKYFVSVAFLIVLSLAVVTLCEMAKLDKLSHCQDMAHSTAREVSILLVLTHEYALFSEERAEKQWYIILSGIVGNLESKSNEIVPIPPEALKEAKLLPELFQQLVRAQGKADDLQESQRNLLLSQLQAGSQSLADSIHLWSGSIGEQRERTELIYHALTLVVPALMLLLLLLLAFLLHRRVLNPLHKLLQAVEATANGDLSVRSSTGTNYEFGELSRRFDEMAIDLVSELKGNIIELNRAEKKTAELADFNMRIFNSTDYHMAVLDADGVILDVNEAWRRFARENMGVDETFGVGASYFVSYNEKWGNITCACDAFEGVKMVQNGVLTHFNLEYSCNGQKNEKRWFLLKVFPLVGQKGAVLVSHSNITERKLAEEELLNEKAFLRSLIDSAGDYIFFKDPNGIYLGCNKAAEQLTGLSEQELIGKSDFDLFNCVQAENILLTDRAVLASGNEIRTKEWVRFNNGNRLLLDTVKAPIFGHDGNIVGIVGISKDITRQNKEESILTARSHLIEYSLDHSLKELLTETLDIVEELTESQIGYFHFLQEDQLSLTLQAWSTRTTRDFCRVEGNDQHYEIEKAGVWVDCIHQRTPVIHNDYASLPHRKGFPPGHATVVRDLAVPIFRSDKIVAILGIGNKDFDYSEEDVLIVSRFADLAWDIAERKMVVESLSESNERFSAAFNNAPIMITISNLEDGTYLDVNQLFLNISGYRREEVIGKTSVDLNWISASDRAQLKESMQQNGRIYDRELSLRTKAGQTKHCKYWGELISVSGHKRLLSIALDVTDHRKIEQQLLQSQKMESIGSLAGGVAHDFNNMLTVIMGHVHFALMELDSNHPACDNLLQIKRTSERSADLTRQLLAFARKQVISPKVIDLNETIDGSLKMLRRLIGENTQLVWLPAPCLWQIMADPSQIDQILANLCVNARDAIKGTGRITIETHNDTVDSNYCGENPDASPGEYVIMSVSDDGSGMDSETMDRVFEPFFTTKGIGEGTGLGLSTVYGIVKQNYGFINIYSEPGKGTTFTIHLPRQEENKPKSLIEAKIVPLPRGQETILLVEDEPSILQITSQLLGRQGYKLLIAGTPGEAMRLAHEYDGEINLLITDVIMPEMNGKDLANTLQSRDPQLKCLYMSGYTDDVIAQHGVLDEGMHFIQKPFSLSDLATKVREVLG